DLARQVGALRRSAASRERSAGASAGGAQRPPGRPAPSAAAGAAAPAPASGARPPAPRAATSSPVPGAPTAAKAQRLYVKIAADHETAAILTSLQAVLREHDGSMPVVLFYEREQKLLALGEQYRVKPSPPLIQAIEAIMGAGAARVK
ncbi:MAG: polymerase subunit alpha, partial [Paenibacillus sp.]|nr:polymerase subunit alpha [Paenibacillus sp.]